jgi:nucleotide sugar dehydrogenase
MTNSKSHVIVIGQGYVGLPLAMAAIQAGYRVTGIDTDSEKVRLLNSGVSPVDDVEPQILQEALSSGLYVASDNYKSIDSFDFAIISVPTPLRNGDPDLTFIREAAFEISKKIRPGNTVILESTTFPGTTEDIFLPILEEGSSLNGRENFYVGYSPERIDPGSAVWTLLNTPKIVSGINEASSQCVESFYRSLGIPTVLVSGTREAELSKLIENTFRHVNVAMINELSKHARNLQANLWEAIDAAATKPFGFMKFTPGPGVGGHCLPIDPSYLSWSVKQVSGVQLKFVSLANEVNQGMPNYVASRAAEILREKKIALAGARVLLIGVAYKPNSGDFREAPSLQVAHILDSMGVKLSAVDNLIREDFWPSELARAETLDKNAFDLAIILTEHNGTKEILEKLGTTMILDTKNYTKGPHVHAL